MDQNQDSGNSSALSNNVVVLLLAMGTAALVVSVYHIIAICCCHQHVTDENQQQSPQGGSEQSTTSSVAHMIPSHKYHKRKVGDVDDDDGGGGGGGGGTSTTCAVCLGDFEEGEELKTLPECIHSFHVACIDMWLHSHTSCPICRASATPSPAGLHHGPFQGFDHGGGDSNANHSSIDTVQIAVVQNGLVRR